MTKSTHEGGPTAGRHRLREIIGILRRHNIIAGLTPQKLVAVLEDLGPTFVKLGQIMSMQPEIMPAEYSKEIAKLKTQATPMSAEEVRAILEGEYGPEWKEIFIELEEKPLGSASIAQVHLATIADGSRAALKIQRAGIYDTMSNDIILLRRAAKILKYTPAIGGEIDLVMVIDEMWTTTKQEMNFLTEAKNIDEFYENNKDVSFVTCPRILDKYTTSHVLVMEYIEGCPIDQAGRLVENGYDVEEIAKKLAHNYVKQIIEDGFFHADPHSGNIIIRDGKIVWIDLGMMGRLGSRDRKLISQALMAVAENDIQKLVDFIITIGVYKEKIDPIALSGDVETLLNKYGGMDFSTMDLAQIIEDLLSILRAHKISMPKGISVLGRGMATIQGTLRTLSPELNLMQIIVEYMSNDLLKHFDIKKELLSILKSLRFSLKKSIDIPAQISDTLKLLSKGIAKVHLDLSMSDDMSLKINAMLNRLVISIIIAALLIGSSLVCTTDMFPQIFGIPALGVLGFLASMFLGGWLIFSILRKK